MNYYKHSGTLGDLIYSLPIVKHTGGGKFYLHLDQINWIGKHYYGSDPAAFHQGRMNQRDFEFLREFMLVQPYITDFEILNPRTSEITHNLDLFRPLFKNHPGNYVDIYADTFGIIDSQIKTTLRTTPWLTVPNPRQYQDRTVVINRTARWLPPTKNPIWDQWLNTGIDQHSTFIGLPQEFQEFIQFSGWKNCVYCPADNLLDMAELIAGCDTFIGNQSVALSLAIGLGKEFFCEARRDLPIERNECYFPKQPNGNYF